MLQKSNVNSALEPNPDPNPKYTLTTQQVPDASFSPGTHGDLFSIESTKGLRHAICQLGSRDHQTAFLKFPPLYQL